MKKLLLLLLAILIVSCGNELPLDSDGDGYSDEYEESMFNIDKPLQYNKLVSDLPMVDIRMVSEPIISINYEGSISRTISSAYSSSSTSERETTISRGYSDTVGGSVSASLTDFGASMEASSTYTFNKSTTNSYSNTFERSRGYEESSGVSFREAKITCPIYIRNLGTSPVVINDIILTAYVEDWYGNTRVIGNLTLDNFELEKLALSGNSSDVILNFKNDTLYPSELESLFSDVKSISVVLSSLSVEDETYYDKKNQVEARTARISIHHSNPSLSKELDIVTNDNTLDDLLNLAHIQYDDNLLYFDGERANFNYDGYTWSINHRGIRNNTPFNDTYTLINKINISSLIVRQGDTVTFYRDDVHWEDSPLGDDLFYYYNDFAMIDFIGETGDNYSRNYWSAQYVTHLSRRSNNNAGELLFVEIFQDEIPDEIYVSFREEPVEVMVNDEVIDMEFTGNGEAGGEFLIIRNLTPETRIDFRFRTGSEGIFTRRVQSYIINYKE